MSKPISFGFGKSKGAAPSKSTVSLPVPKAKPASGLKSTLRNDSDNEEEEEPKHESVTGFSPSGAVLSRPVQEKAERIIKNTGNGDWRKRGKNLLPVEVQAAQNGTVLMVERDEVSKASGLQFAGPNNENGEPALPVTLPQSQAKEEEAKPLTEDEIAMAALLDDGSGKPKTNAIIKQLGNTRLAPQDETADFRADVKLRPDSSTLEDYAAMPVEEFGMAMLRGMGQKRRANGEIIDLNAEKKEETPRKSRKQEGFLGIGAKAAPGAEIELGAWGKADMRKNNKGEGFFTPLMRENKATGERITEEEFQQRLKESKGKKVGEDWRERRDRNLERSGRDRKHSKKDGDQKMLTNGDGYRDQMNGFSRDSSSSRRERDDREYDSSRSRRDRDERDSDRSLSRQDRSHSRDRRRRDDDDYESRHQDKHKDKYRDDERYDSSSSHRSRYRDRDDDRRHRDKR
jgi:G-patch domain